MFSFSILTTIIGFLIGWIFYLVIEPYTTFIFLFGGLGYIIGLILDTSERKRQLETFDSSSMLYTHEIFHSPELPEAVFIYSSQDNTTSVLLDYKIEAKPENYRLSVLKNLQEFDFRIIEDTSQTIFSLCIEYPEFQYPSLNKNQQRMFEFYYDIKERSSDFQGAIQKLIPGIVISKIQNPDILGSESLDKTDFSSLPPSSFFPSSPSNHVHDQSFENEKQMKLDSSTKLDGENIESYIKQPDNSIGEAEDYNVETQGIDEEKILEDLSQRASKKQTYPEEDISGIFLSEGIDDQLKESENRSESTRKLKGISFLTAKQIEEKADHVLATENAEKTQSKPDISFQEIENNEESQQSIFDYSSVKNSTSMPLDESGEGILSTISKAVEKLHRLQSKDPEKISAEDS